MASRAAADSGEGRCVAASTTDQRVRGKTCGARLSEILVFTETGCSYQLQLPETRRLLPGNMNQIGNKSAQFVQNFADSRTRVSNQQTSFNMNKLPPAGDPKRSLHILCIDDDEQILEMLKACLSHYGHRIEVASGGKRGLELFCAAILKSKPYDAVITDLAMPDIDGCQVACSIKIESPDTPILLLTAWGSTLKDDAAIVSTVDAVMSKPPRMHELNHLLHRMAG
jgi:CheY-like chemotaxis protein